MAAPPRVASLLEPLPRHQSGPLGGAPGTWLSDTRDRPRQSLGRSLWQIVTAASGMARWSSHLAVAGVVVTAALAMARVALPAELSCGAVVGSSGDWCRGEVITRAIRIPTLRPIVAALLRVGVRLVRFVLRFVKLAWFDSIIHHPALQERCPAKSITLRARRVFSSRRYRSVSCKRHPDPSRMLGT